LRSRSIKYRSADRQAKIEAEQAAKEAKKQAVSTLGKACGCRLPRRKAGEGFYDYRKK